MKSWFSKEHSTTKVIEYSKTHAGSAAWAIADQGAGPLVQLFLAPWLLHRLGTQEFALWALGNAFIGMSQIVSLGSPLAVTKHVSADLAAGANLDAINAIRAAVAIVLVVGSTAALFIWIMAPTIAAAFFFRIGIPAHVAQVIGLSGLAALIQELDSVCSAALRGAERFDLCAKTEMPLRLAMGAVTATTAGSIFNVHELFIALIGMMVGKTACKVVAVQSLFRVRKCCTPVFAIAPIRRMLEFGIWQWLQSAGTIFFAAADQLIIGSVLGAASLARYSICLQLAQYVHVLPNVMTQVIFPRFSAMNVSTDSQAANDLLTSATWLAFGVAFALGFVLVSGGYLILRIWMGSDFALANYTLLLVLSVVGVVLAYNIGGYYFLMGTNRGSRAAVIVMFAGVSQALLAALVAPWGLFAVAWSRMAYALLTSALYFEARRLVKT